MLTALVVIFIILAIIAAAVALTLVFAFVVAAVSVGGWILATVVGIQIAGYQEKREEILLASIGILLVAMLATLIVVW